MRPISERVPILPKSVLFTHTLESKIPRQARCLRCGQPTMRRLDLDVGICAECEQPVGKSSAIP